jgi:Fe2+ transport system protein FeoA
METTLDRLRAGGRGQVASFLGEIDLQRYLEMGLTPGTEIEVVRFAPLGDPMEIRVRGYALSLRKSDAACIAVLPA